MAKFLIKSKRKHGNVEEFRWSRNGYPDDALMGVVEEIFVTTKDEAFEEFADLYDIMNDTKLPKQDFDVHVIKSDEQLGELMYD